MALHSQLCALVELLASPMDAKVLGWNDTVFADILDTMASFSFC